MIASMTGYAVKTIPTPVGMMTLELKAVNHRFLDATFRLPILLGLVPIAIMATMLARWYARSTAPA